MKTFLSVREAAEQWNISERRVSELCSTGRVPGSLKEGRSWRIPANAEKPADLRYKKERGTSTGKLPSSEERVRLPLPVGISEYKEAVDNYYYVDKTLFLRDFLDTIPKVSLFTRPRRFGKTLTMDMVKTFFEKTEEDNSIYFKNMAIWKCGKAYTRHMGAYPVVFLTLKDCKFDTWEETKANLLELLAAEYARHRELAGSDRLSEVDRAYYHSFMNGTATDPSMALKNLSRMLHTQHQSKVVIIVDEYDVPIQAGYSNGFYEDVVAFMRNLFSGAFKDNVHLAYGFMTGILRIAKESIFSGLNNLTIYSVLDTPFCSYFGFTLEEVTRMAEYYGLEDHVQELCDWYDGYRFGDKEIFNPWSVINYFSSHGKAGSYWVSTSSNDILKILLRSADNTTYENILSLLKGNSIWCSIDTNTVYPELDTKKDAIYSILLLSGYLNVLQRSFSPVGDLFCECTIPNKEVDRVFRKEILAELEHRQGTNSTLLDNAQMALLTKNVSALQSVLTQYLKETVSFYDTVGETFYQGLVLGFCILLTDYYKVTSNRESGLGRYDIQLVPLQSGFPGVLVELKAEKTPGHLEEAALRALDQIEEKEYETELIASGISDILKIGLAFSGKEMVLKENRHSIASQ